MGRKYWLPGRSAFTPLCSAVRKTGDTEPVYNSYKRPLYKDIGSIIDHVAIILIKLNIDDKWLDCFKIFVKLIS
jgi:hypothetical protein